MLCLNNESWAKVLNGLLDLHWKNNGDVTEHAQILKLQPPVAEPALRLHPGLNKQAVICDSYVLRTFLIQLQCLHFI